MTASGSEWVPTKTGSKKKKKPIDRYRVAVSGFKKIEQILKGEVKSDFQVIVEMLKGGAGSGNHGHAGRPGQVGGSAPSGGGGGRTKAPKGSGGRARNELGQFIASKARGAQQDLKNARKAKKEGKQKEVYQNAKKAGQKLLAGVNKSPALNNQIKASLRSGISSAVNRSGKGGTGPLNELGQFATDLLRHAKEIAA